MDVVNTSSFPTPAAMIVNVAAPELPPPGAAVKTVTSAVPATAMSDEGMVAISRVGPAKVVERSLPFHRTELPGIKFDPSTFKKKPGAPAAAIDGESEATTGTG